MNANTYNFVEIEKKWQKQWEETELYKTDMQDIEKKLYCLVMFIYPSGDKLHIGHWYNYGPTDTWARFKRMQGYNVLEPMGYDAFGLPAENYAIKQGIHPKVSTENNIHFIRQQLKSIGAMYDWTKEINTSDPVYYRWTQWFFLQLFKKGLAYRKKSAVNWCPQCKTVLANEQVINGLCERCDSEVTKKNLEQWFLKITNYAQRLLDGLPDIDWPEKTKAMQKYWIGRSEGASIVFPIVDHEETLEVFTTRPDTLFGVTYMVLAPEHPFVQVLTTSEFKKEVDDYISAATKQTEIERTSTEKEKTGVPTGSYAINPINGEKIPIWIADYVLLTYGTGAVMAVPAHDQRDFEFAQKYNLPIREVISPNGEDRIEPMTVAFEEPGIMINSGKFNGLDSKVGIDRVIEELEVQKIGGYKINYKLRDWLVSRQRYWGTPIPIIYCQDCGQVPIPEKDLPVLLPENVEFTGKGESPLTTAEDFVNTVCPKCGKSARREVDTMDTFVCSSWYFLRFPNPHIHAEAFDKEMVKNWLPVDQYVGGAEHATMHLLYARFFTMVLYDLGLVDFQEPFTRLVHQGVITNRGTKMSKSKGNVVNPELFIVKYGSDTFRIYMMFMGSYEDGGDWSDEGITGVYRFLNRVWRLILTLQQNPPKGKETEQIQKVVRQCHYAIKHVTQDLQRFQFNTAISRIMELVNEMYIYIQEVPPDKQNAEQMEFVQRMLVQLIAPFAPHLGEELWNILGEPYSIFNSRWPNHDESVLERAIVTIVVQVNGKVRGRVETDKDSPDKEIIDKALQDAKVQKYTAGKNIVKTVVVPNKLLSIVAK